MRCDAMRCNKMNVKPCCPLLYLLPTILTLLPSSLAAVVAEYFPDPSERNAAYATIYFSSGFAGAIGYLLFNFVPVKGILVLNAIVAVAAILCFHLSYVLHKKNKGEDSSADEVLIDKALS
jgi:MFS family permease